jgi:DNA-binding LacI/PurR family transcriptional regulator
MDDIARLAGVSRPTVSKALSGARRVNPRTRSRILAIAKQMNFVPLGAAQALGRGSTQLVGVYSTHGGLPGPWSVTILAGMGRVLRTRQYDLLVLTHADSDGPVPRVVRQRFVDAMLLVHSRDASIEAYLRSARLPYLIVNGGATPDCDYVMPDNAAAMQIAVDHLRELGHRRIGYVGTPTPVHVSATERAAGYAEAMARAELAALPDYSSYVPVEVRVADLLALPKAPSALVCYSDEIAMEVVAALAGRGITVPRQMSVIGCDDLSPAMQFFAPPLSTVRMPFAELGERAAELLMDRLNDPHAAPRGEVLSTGLACVRRGSTGPVSE